MCQTEVRTRKEFFNSYKISFSNLSKKEAATFTRINSKSKDYRGPILKSLWSLSLAAQIDVKPCFTFNSIGQKTAICWGELCLFLPF